MGTGKVAIAGFLASLLVLACEHHDLKSKGATDARDGDGASPDGGVETKAGRAPAHHRPASDVCPQGRGTGLPRLDGCSPDASSGLVPQCWQDSDCTMGTNGRCLSGHFACMSNCSYDACNSDTDCPSKIPCVCRSSALDSAANVCATDSNCAVDADCGPEGYCSPSQVNNFCFCPSTALCPDTTSCYAGTTKVPCACGDSCGHGYYCHTPRDECLDDSDCDRGSCNYDRLEGRWLCALCWPVP